MRILPIAILLLLSPFANAQSATVKEAAQNVCKVISGTQLGSGTFLKDENVNGDWVLTAAHVIDNKGLKGKVVCEFLNGEKISGTVMGIDTTYDQAAIWLAKAPDLPGCDIRDHELTAGESIWFVGFAHGEDFTYRNGKYTSLRGTPNKSGAQPDWCEGDVAAFRGMSGGPVFDENGHVCGNLWGSDFVNSTVFVCVNRNVHFLRLLFPRAYERFKQRQQQNCPDGRCPIQPQPQIPTQPPTDPAPSQPSTAELKEIRDRLDQLEALIKQLQERPGCECPKEPAIDIKELLKEITGYIDAKTGDLATNESVTALNVRITELESQNKRLAENQIAIIDAQNALSKRHDELASSHAELSKTTSNLVDASNALLAQLNAKTDPEAIAKALPGIRVIANGESIGEVHLGKSLNLTHVPISNK